LKCDIYYQTMDNILKIFMLQQNNLRLYMKIRNQKPST